MFQIRTEGSMFGVAEAEPELHLIISNFYYHPPNVGSRGGRVGAVPAPHRVVFARAEEPHGVPWPWSVSNMLQLFASMLHEAHHRHVREAQHREYRPPNPHALRMLRRRHLHTLLAHGFSLPLEHKV